jgi:cytochrome c-type biogenesis protein CcmH/NrfF
MSTAVAWIIGIAAIIGLHVVLWEQPVIILFLWGLVAILSLERERRKAASERDRLKHGSWIDQHHEDMERFRADHDDVQRPPSK